MNELPSEVGAGEPPCGYEQEVDRLCDEFERRLREKAAPLIEDYLAQLPRAARTIGLQNLLAVELELRHAAGEPIDADGYRRRFPADRDIVDAELRRAAAEAAFPSTGTAASISSTSDGPLSAGVQVAEHEPLAERLGRYQVLRLLGEGGFGRVYLADDAELGRQVAIKVPRKRLFDTGQSIEVFLQEARTAAQLQHPGIVTVYDVTREGELVFIVQEYLPGDNLASQLQARTAAVEWCVELMAAVAEAVAFAHQRGFVHRDLKPANILLGADGKPRVADFGLAVHESIQRRLRGERSGTPPYMSPEQVRGETHRLDGRSDTWSLGVILYELLCGRRPFQGATRGELFDEIVHREPRPPRELKPELPAELERICLKCLSKRVTDRYPTAADLAGDLRNWLQHPHERTAERRAGPAKVVPRGLRSFGPEDQDFFLNLLPGPRDRDGLPESIRFWKSRCETQSGPTGAAAGTFAIGLIYGASGGGKSSLVKAGLLPRLAPHVRVVYVEAAPDDTEVRLIKGLRRQFPDLPADVALPQLLAGLREGLWVPPGQKVLVVLDQFEQWLHAKRGEPDPQLMQALRHCDGARLQCLLLVRDDFWAATSRFTRGLEIPLVDGENQWFVDLFDPLHARHVLAEFGRAYGRLPENLGEISQEQQAFLDQAVAELSEEGKIVCVRLALFADMVKAKPWAPATLKQIGGIAGVGVTFLEETFSADSAPAAYRRREKAAQAVLKALLPEVGTNIKGGRQSEHALLEASGCQRQDFDELLRILDKELRLVSPTDPDGSEEGERNDERPAQHTGPADSSLIPNPSSFIPPSSIIPPSSLRFFQLTHDYLVPSLREWLTRKQRETRRGRAELRLAERAAIWTARPERRHLPSGWECLSIALLTGRKSWTEPQRRMMRAASRVHLARATVAVTLFVAVVLTAATIRRRVVKQQDLTRAQGLVDALVNADTSQVPGIVRQLGAYAERAEPLLRKELTQATDDSTARLHLSLALVRTDERQVEYLYEQLLRADAARLPVIRDALADHQARITERLWTVLSAPDGDSGERRLRAAAALARYDPGGAQWSNVAPDVAAQLVAVNPVFVGQWQEMLRPVAEKLLDPLAKIFTDPAQAELSRTLATSLLADYAKNDPQMLTDLLTQSDAKSFATLFPAVQAHATAAVERLQAMLTQKIEPSWNDPPLDAGWTEPSAAARAMIETAQGMLDDRFAFCQTMPWEDFPRVAEALRQSGYRPTRVRPYRSLLAPREDIASRSDPTTLVAAIWTRDGNRWELQTDLGRDDVPKSDAPAERDGLLPADVGVLPAADASADRRIVLLWSEPMAAGEQRRVLVDASEQELIAAQTELPEQGFAAQSTIGVWTDGSGQRHYLGIWSNQGAPSELRAAYAGFELVDQPQWDVAVAPAAKLADPLDAFRRQLAEIEKLPAAQLDQPQVRLARARAQYHLGQLEPALADLDSLIQKQAVSAQVLHYRAWTLAQLGKSEEARAELAKNLEQPSDPSTKAYVQIVAAAWLGDHDEAASQLEAAATAAEKNADALYNAACAAALASQSCGESEAERARHFADRALELLGAAVAQGYKNAQHLRADVDLAPLHADPRFIALVEKLEPPARYAAVWRADVDFESRLLAELPLESLLEQSRELAAQGYRPAAIASSTGFQPVKGESADALSSIGFQPVKGESPRADAAEADPTITGRMPVLLCASVWHRPVVPDQAKEKLAQRQATAAAALLRMASRERSGSALESQATGGQSTVFSLFQHRPDPRLRSYLLHRLAPYGVEPALVLARLREEQEVSSRRALILAVGEFARAKLLSDEQQSAARADLARWYGEDPDAGVHGAAEWGLRQLGAETEIANVREAYATGQVVGERQWYVTKEGRQMLVVLRPEEFLMGSPVTEAERFQGPTGKNEIRHRRRIGRTFAIAVHEVTVEQFRGFRADHRFERTYAREDDAPANMITWYDAAAFCNWLSEREGIPRDQWCYDPDQPFAEGMPLYADYLARTGYRLPTEAEWEYGCRAGATMARYYGETDQLLGDYAWYTKNSQDRWMLPVGSLKPNDAGLFDVLGNVVEWCQDRALLYSKEQPWREDEEQMGNVAGSQSRVLRGGSFIFVAPLVRSAYRLTDRPVDRNNLYGFRVARTYPLSP